MQVAHFTVTRGGSCAQRYLLMRSVGNNEESDGMLDETCNGSNGSMKRYMDVSG